MAVKRVSQLAMCMMHNLLELDACGFCPQNFLCPKQHQMTCLVHTQHSQSLSVESSDEL